MALTSDQFSSFISTLTLVNPLPFGREYKVQTDTKHKVYTLAALIHTGLKHNYIKRLQPMNSLHKVRTLFCCTS